MTLKDTTGNTLDKSDFEALLTEEPTGETKYKLSEPVYESYPFSGERDDNESGRRQKFKTGTILTQSDVDALYPEDDDNDE